MGRQTIYATGLIVICAEEKSDRGVGRELEDHDNILLGLVCEHQWALQEEILLSGHDKTQRDKQEGKDKGRQERERVQEKKRKTC